MKNKTVRLIILIDFIVLIAAFVAYKMGAFDKFFKDDNPAQTSSSGKNDTSQKIPADTSINLHPDSIPMMMSGSKSGRILDPARPLIITRDTLRTDTFTSVKE